MSKLRVLFTLFCACFFAYMFYLWKEEDSILKENGVSIKAVISSKKKYKRGFRYKSSFRFNSSRFDCNFSSDRIFMIGDTIEVIMNKDNPSMNKPKFQVYD